MEVENRRTLCTIGIGEIGASGDPADLLITYSLGSCLGIGLFDPVTGIAGLVHCMLASASVCPDKARERPGMCVDTGVPELIRRMEKLGARGDRLIVKVAGGSCAMDPTGKFKIGERNYAALRKVLWERDLLIESEDIGGTVARTMSIFPGDGRVVIRVGREESSL